MLNHAVGDPAHGLTDDSAWRLVRPFQRVARGRGVHFTAAQVRRLIALCDDPAFGSLVTAGFLTGARYGELAVCQVRYFDASGSLHIPSGKTGPRTVIPQPDAVQFFGRLVAKRVAEAPLLARADGLAWAASHQLRPMKRALLLAELESTGTFYALRHS